jgi:hypothetical protein
MIAGVSGGRCVLCKGKNSCEYAVLDGRDAGLLSWLYQIQVRDTGVGAAVSEVELACGWWAALVVLKCETGASLPYV